MFWNVTLLTLPKTSRHPPKTPRDACTPQSPAHYPSGIGPGSGPIRFCCGTEKGSAKKSGMIGAKVKALKDTMQKATSEAAYFDRQALSAQRFLAGIMGSVSRRTGPPRRPTRSLSC